MRTKSGRIYVSGIVEHSTNDWGRDREQCDELYLGHGSWTTESLHSIFESFMGKHVLVTIEEIEDA